MYLHTERCQELDTVLPMFAVQDMRQSTGSVLQVIQVVGINNAGVRNILRF